MKRPDFIESLESAANKATRGYWSLPHFADEGVKCNCKYVLSDGYMGCIAEVDFDNGKPIGDEGGNDSPPIEEAKANALHISTARPENILELIRYVKVLEKALSLSSQVQRRSLLLSDEVYETRDKQSFEEHIKRAENRLYPEAQP